MIGARASTSPAARMQRIAGQAILKDAPIVVLDKRQAPLQTRRTKAKIQKAFEALMKGADKY